MKFKVGQVVRMDTGEYAKITKVLPASKGTGCCSTVWVNIAGRFYEDTWSSVRVLTKREMGQ